MGKEDNKPQALIFIEQYMSMHRYSLVFETMVSVDKSICLLHKSILEWETFTV